MRMRLVVSIVGVSSEVGISLAPELDVAGTGSAAIGVWWIVDTQLWQVIVYMLVYRTVVIEVFAHIFLACVSGRYRICGRTLAYLGG